MAIENLQISGLKTVTPLQLFWVSCRQLVPNPFLHLPRPGEAGGRVREFTCSSSIFGSGMRLRIYRLGNRPGTPFTA
jgi:hypothetical protein